MKQLKNLALSAVLALPISFMLRESVGLRGHGQKDPLIEYKSEGYELFLEMMINIRRDVVHSPSQFQLQV